VPGAWLLFAAALLQAGAPEQEPGGPSAAALAVPRQEGFCAGISWIDLRPGEVLTKDDGPDFTVYRVTGPDGREWGVYSGMAGMADPDRKLLRKDSKTIFRGVETGEAGKRTFSGYFVSSKGAQNHFFGNVFHDSTDDRSFFDRVRFGAAAKLRCGSRSG
jgi:hypothetical protein